MRDGAHRLVGFELPFELGYIALIEAYVYAAGQTSVWVRVRVYGENSLTGKSAVTTESYFVFVAIDESHNPVAVPELTVWTEEGKLLLDQALADE